MTRPVLLASLLGLAALGGCGGKATRAECTQMIDKYVDMLIAADETLQNLSPAEQHAAREMKKALRVSEPGYKQVQEQCETEVTKSEYRCAMKAPTPEKWQACID